MRFTKALYDLLVINPEGISDQRVYDLGMECGITRQQLKFLRKRMCQVGILGFKRIEKKGAVQVTWILREPKQKKNRAGKLRTA